MLTCIFRWWSTRCHSLQIILIQLHSRAQLFVAVKICWTLRLSIKIHSRKALTRSYKYYRTKKNYQYRGWSIHHEMHLFMTTRVLVASHKSAAHFILKWPSKEQSKNDQQAHRPCNWSFKKAWHTNSLLNIFVYGLLVRTVLGVFALYMFWKPWNCLLSWNTSEKPHFVINLHKIVTVALHAPEKYFTYDI